jgi:predicted PurR-regulated permease PerM
MEHVPPVAEEQAPAHPRVTVHPAVAITAAYAWRLLVIGLLVFATLWVAGKMLVVLVPLGVAALLTRALWPVSQRLRDRGLRPALAAAVAVLGFVVLIVGALGLVGWAVAGELDEIQPTLSQGLDDVSDWLVEDSPFDVSRADVDRWRAEAGDAVGAYLRSGGGGGDTAEERAVLAGEVILGVLLSIIVTFFFLKDGSRMIDRVVRWMPMPRRALTRRALGRAWTAAGGYLRGAALLGLVEAIVIGAVLLLVGADLVAPVMLLTFLAAFVPIVGAIAAALVAVLVALVTAGTGAAVIVALVALVVQQLDNDVLAPVIYGRAIRLHPLVVLLGIAAGGALFGLVGTVFAVPVLAVVLNATDQVRSELQSPS